MIGDEISEDLNLADVDYFPVNPEIFEPTLEEEENEDGVMFCVNSFRNLKRIKDRTGDSRSYHAFK